MRFLGFAFLILILSVVFLIAWLLVALSSSASGAFERGSSGYLAREAYSAGGFRDQGIQKRV